MQNICVLIICFHLICCILRSMGQVPHVDNCFEKETFLRYKLIKKVLKFKNVISQKKTLFSLAPIRATFSFTIVIMKLISKGVDSPILLSGPENSSCSLFTELEQGIFSIWVLKNTINICY